MSVNLQKFLTRKHCIFVDDILVSAQNDEKRFLYQTGLPDYVRDLEIVDGDFYFDKSWMDGVTQKYANSVNDFFFGFVKRGYASGEKLKKFARELNVISIPSDQLESTFVYSTELLKDLIVFLTITHPLAKVIEQRLTKVLILKGVSDDQINEALLELSQPTKLNTPAQELADLRKIKQQAQGKNFDLEGALLTHTREYGFLGYREPFSKAYDVSFFRDRLNDQSAEHKSGKKFDLNFSRSEQETIELMKEMVYFRNYRTEKLYEALYFIEPLWRALSKKHNLTNDTDLGYYTFDEIVKLFKDGQKISDFVIRERKDGHAILLNNNVQRLITGEELKAKKARVNVIGDLETKEITGSVACRGQVSGRAKIVLKASEQSKVQNGEILVTSMTTPDFIPCMKKASAFVTDEGGITCHAAIVAREMNKPCIIGTKFATKIIKDGDLIEVDANKGLVRILSV